ncbi:Bystin-domain-containing protein [Myriangium duriaei CBS 260.36]|uniref:Bystin-domain-containing protein n=1 Tax=Myriangium duriaei CBS 260.36 TaxID=1168546 RepID=A0A9P4MRH4_9PEZI|nr:Bystin-domain-containing protein [Myriangium duriaei CBS 260.36]
MAKAAQRDTRIERRHNPLSEDYLPKYTEKQRTPKRKKSQVDGGDVDAFVDSKASRKILKIGQDLADEDAEERQAQQPAAPNKAFDFESRFAAATSSDDEQVGEYDDGEGWEDEEEEEVEVEGADVDPTDLAMFNRFNPEFDPSTLLQPEANEEEQQGTNLADLILEKIAAHEASREANGEPHEFEPPEDAVELPAKVVEVYTQVGLILSRYKSGKLPKPFKILPTLPQWDLLLSITRPENWSPNAHYEATKLFISSRPAVAQAFLHDILLPRIREEQHETKKLNVHFYKALKKALYKPACFFKGFLFPLVESGTCTLREAHIIGSVLTRVSIPVLHSAAALYRLCEVAAEQMSVNTESGGATNILIRVLLEKKYALPFKVVDALVFHFLRFRATDLAAETGAGAMGGLAGAGAKAESQKLPVLWHQCLLAFAQRYKNDITEDQREALLDLLLVRGHRAIGPEVRRELLEGRGRGVPVQENAGVGGDDTMIDV